MSATFSVASMAWNPRQWGFTRSCSEARESDRQAADRSFAVYIVATTPGGTRAALATATMLARDLDSRIVVLVPHIVPYVQPLDQPADSVSFAAERFRRVATALAVETEIRVCLCRPHSRSLVPLLPHDAPILVGGRRGRLWRTREERLIADLRGSGRRAIFVDDTRQCLPPRQESPEEGCLTERVRGVAGRPLVAFSDGDGRRAR